MERVIAEAPPHLEQATPDTGMEPFHQVLHPFARLAIADLGARIAHLSNIEHPTVLNCIRASLECELSRAAARTLVHELHRRRTVGHLKGSTPELRFLNFVHRAGSQAGLYYLCNNYPVLARIIGQICLRTVDSVTELFDRFANDRSEIVNTLLTGTDPGDVISVRLALGDRHDGGRSVSMLTFGDGRAVINRPRPVELHRHFAELLSWINKRLPGLDLRTVECLVKRGYGWMEVVEHSPCASVGDIERFYWRQGALLAVLYLADATDIHHENLIAVADQPVLVDVETLFQPVFSESAVTGHDPAAAALNASVARTALLPTMVYGTDGALDISGLGATEGANYPRAIGRWIAAGTDTMHLAHGPAPFLGSANRPKLGGRTVDPMEYLPRILAGFRAGYDAIIEDQEDLRTQLLPRFACDDIRVIIRNTQRYATLLTDSTHPTVLANAASRDRLFDRLRDDSLPPQLSDLPAYEIADLWQGDIPVVYSRPNARDLWIAGYLRLADHLHQTGMEAVLAKLAGMGAADRARQEWLISATFAVRLAPVDHFGCPGPTPQAVPTDRGRASGSVDLDHLVLAASRIADDISACALRDSTRTNWLGIEALDDRFWCVLPMGAGLPTGYCGVALFLAQLGQLTGTTRYLDAAAAAVRPLGTLVSHMSSDPARAAVAGVGFAGLGGIAYALTRLAALFDDHSYNEQARKAVAAMALVPAQGHDVAGGAAGGLSALMALYRESGCGEAASLARVLADQLVGASPLRQRGGFLYGSAGIGWALLQFAAGGLARPDHVTAGRAALSRAVVDPHVLGWCSGAAGTAAAAAHPLARAGGVLARASAALVDAPVLNDSSACHGEIGLLHGLAASTARGEERAVRRQMRGLRALSDAAPCCGTPTGVSTPGMLAGSAGIGYGLLHLGFPDRVPSALLLEPATLAPSTSDNSEGFNERLH